MFRAIAFAIVALWSTYAASETAASGTALPTQLDDDQVRFFETKVRPLLAEHCYACHSAQAERLEGSLRLDHGTFYESGGDSGSAIDHENLDDSLFLQAVRFETYEMPPSGKLSDEQIAVLTQWIHGGAYWPDEEIPNSNTTDAPFDLWERSQSHWAWEPIHRRTPPAIDRIADQGRAPASMIDAWIQDRLTKASLQPAAPSDRETLVRRIYWDLIGVPPTHDELLRWVQDESIDWYSQLVESLLADPQFGVRFARHWMDLVRYAQSRGHEFDEDIPGAEHYRDYLVRAFNADVPYDQFLMEHVAGDLLKSPRRHPQYRWNESVLGTGFWHLGEWIHSPVDTRKDEADRFDNMIDVFSKTFLGLTVACARCHDHKFDAISTADYYALSGVLRSSHYNLMRFEKDESDYDTLIALKHLRTKYQEQIQHILEGDREGLLSILSEGNGAPTPIERTTSYLQDPVNLPARFANEDEALALDLTSLASNQFRTNGLTFGDSIRPAGWEGLRLSDNRNAEGTPSVSFPIEPELTADPFWASQRSEVRRTNVMNRYTQVDTSGSSFFTPLFELRGPRLFYLVKGSFRAFAAIDSYRLLAGPLHSELLFESRAEPGSGWRWVEGGDLARYLGSPVHLELSPLDEHGFSIAQVAFARPLEASRSNDSSSYDGTKGQPGAELAQTALLLQAISEIKPTDKSPESVRKIQTILQEWRDAENALAQNTEFRSRVALVMRDGPVQEGVLYIRGNTDRPGGDVERRFLEALGGVESPISSDHESGRMQLAEQMLAPNNPLVARVISNRLWHHLIGRGIVSSTDDFGVQGREPTHPELLDELAVSLRESNWSIKSLVRSICLSDTYRQQTSPGTMPEEDPTNALVSFAFIQKLPGEAVRDGLFRVAGQLDLRLEGGTEKVHLSSFLTGRGRPGESGSMHGSGRRSIYLEVRRNFLNPMLTAFDMPTPFSSMGRRNASNVPAQALTLLNDPMVHWLAERWAVKMLAEEMTAEERVVQMLRSARGRDPTEMEVQHSLRFLRLEQNLGETGSTDKEVASNPAVLAVRHTPHDSQEPELEIWVDFAHVLLNSKELQFRF